MSEGKNLATKEKKMGTLNKVYILHGWTYSTDKWKPFVEFLKQKGIDSTLLKIPGLTEKLDKAWKIEDYIEWLKNKVGNKVILIGHSNGGRIALNFSIKYPGKVAKLILIDSAGIYHNDIFIKIKRGGFFILAKIGKKIIPLDGT